MASKKPGDKVAPPKKDKQTENYQDFLGLLRKRENKQEDEIPPPESESPKP